MIVCPMCEHTQASGTECEVCGRALVVRRTPPVQVGRLAELEDTGFAATGSVEATGSTFEGLEVTRAAPVRVGRVDTVPELERGRAEVVDVPVVPMGDLDSGRFESPAERAPAADPTQLTCRYCRKVHPANATGFCDGCGMRLPRRANAGAAASPGRAEEPRKIRHGCGSLTLTGGPCDGCGVFLPLAGEK